MASLNKHLITAYAGYFFRYAYLIILIPFYARVLGPSAYGVVLAAMSVQNIVWTLQNWGFAYSGSRNIAAAREPAARNHEYSRHLTARFILLPLALAAGLIATFSSSLLREHLFIAMLGIACGVIAGFNLGWYFQGRLQFKTPVLLEIFGFCITLPLVLITVRGPSDANNVMLALTVSGVLSSAAAYVIAGRTEKQILAPWRAGVGLVKEATPLFLTSGAFMLLTNVGTYSLALFSTADQVAYFGTAEKVITTGLGLLGPVGQVMLTWFSKMVHENSDAQEVLDKQDQAVKWVAMAGGAATLACLTVVPPLLTWILGEKFAHASTLLMIMSPVFFLAAIGNAISIYILLPRRMDTTVSRISVISTVTGALSIGAGAYLGHANGAAIARVLSELVGTSLLVMLYRGIKREAKLGQVA